MWTFQNRITILLLLFCALPVWGEEIVLKSGKAKAYLIGNEDKDGKLRIPLSGQIRLRLVVTGIDLEVKEQNPIEKSGKWDVFPDGPKITKGSHNGRNHWERSWILEPQERGLIAIELAPIKYQEDSGTWQETEWERIPVQVTSNYKGELGELVGEPQIEEVESEVSSRLWIYFGIGGGILVFGGVLGFLYLRKRPGSKETPRPPEETAIKELDRLEKDIQNNTQNVRACPTGLVKVLRTYLQSKFDVSLEEKTKAEALNSLQEVQNLPPDQLDHIKEVWQQCDLARFTPVTEMSVEWPGVIQKVRAIIAELANTEKTLGA